MQKLILIATTAALTLTMITPIVAKPLTQFGFSIDQGTADFDKRRRPRVPGGSGCDDPGDLIEHPECRP